MDKNIFYEKLKIGITSIFQKIDEKEEIFSFGIFVDQDVSSMLVVYNTYRHFANQLKEEFLSTHKVKTEYRWLIPEWFKRVDENNALFNEANDMLYHVIQPTESEVNPDFKDTLLDLLTDVLLTLKEEGLFSSMKVNSFIYLEQADSYIDDSQRNRIKKLIGEKYFAQFLYDLRNDGRLGRDNPFAILEQKIQKV